MPLRVPQTKMLLATRISSIHSNLGVSGTFLVSCLSELLCILKRSQEAQALEQREKSIRFSRSRAQLLTGGWGRVVCKLPWIIHCPNPVGTPYPQEQGKRLASPPTSPGGCLDGGSVSTGRCRREGGGERGRQPGIKKVKGKGKVRSLSLHSLFLRGLRIREIYKTKGIPPCCSRSDIHPSLRRLILLTKLRLTN